MNVKPQRLCPGARTAPHWRRRWHRALARGVCGDPGEVTVGGNADGIGIARGIYPLVNIQIAIENGHL